MAMWRPTKEGKAIIIQEFRNEIDVKVAIGADEPSEKLDVQDGGNAKAPAMLVEAGNVLVSNSASGVDAGRNCDIAGNSEFGKLLQVGARVHFVFAPSGSRASQSTAAHTPNGVGDVLTSTSDSKTVTIVDGKIISII